MLLGPFINYLITSAGIGDKKNYNHDLGDIGC